MLSHEIRREPSSHPIARRLAALDTRLVLGRDVRTGRLGVWRPLRVAGRQWICEYEFSRGVPCVADIDHMVSRDIERRYEHSDRHKAAMAWMRQHELEEAKVREDADAVYDDAVEQTIGDLAGRFDRGTHIGTAPSGVGKKKKGRRQRIA